MSYEGVKDHLENKLDDDLYKHKSSNKNITQNKNQSSNSNEEEAIPGHVFITGAFFLLLILL